MAPSAKTDPRITRAKKVLKEGLTAGDEAKANAPSRATGQRARFKCGHEAAEHALAILTEAPKGSKARRGVRAT